VRYRIREVDGCDESVAEDIEFMHRVCFGKSAPPVDPRDGDWWWLAYNHKWHPVAFACLAELETDKLGGYLKRVGVVPGHRGLGLQRRLVTARERKARKLGMHYVVTDTTYNTPSSNSLIRAGYKLYRPKNPWGWKHTLYWKKDMK
jgi:GNAT superfamily N-acetyltransferase